MQFYPAVRVSTGQEWYELPYDLVMACIDRIDGMVGGGDD